MLNAKEECELGLELHHLQCPGEEEFREIVDQAARAQVSGAVQVGQSSETQMLPANALSGLAGNRVWAMKATTQVSDRPANVMKGTVLCLRPWPDSEDGMVQLLVSADGQLYARAKWNGAWCAWRAAGV